MKLHYLPPIIYISIGGLGILPPKTEISILELEIGILLVERRDQRQGTILRAWMEGHVLPTFSGRILAIDTAVAQRCAALHVPNPRSDRDALIAATALVHGMTVVTRNVTDFQPMSVALVNPWQS